MANLGGAGTVLHGAPSCCGRGLYGLLHSLWMAAFCARVMAALGSSGFCLKFVLLAVFDRSKTRSVGAAAALPEIPTGAARYPGRLCGPKPGGVAVARRVSYEQAACWDAQSAPPPPPCASPLPMRVLAALKRVRYGPMYAVPGTFRPLRDFTRSSAGFCIHLEKQRALSKVEDHFKRKGKYDYTNRRKLSRTYNALLWKMIRESLEGFLLPHGCAAQDLVFQCDADCRDFANDQGWRHENRGPAHSLADILAWGNSHEREPAGTVRIDIADRLGEQTLKRFK